MANNSSDQSAMSRDLSSLRKLLSAHEISSTSSSRAFLTTDTLSHYLTAHNNSVTTAAQAVLSTLSWRETYKPDKLEKQHLQSLRSEAASGKLYVVPTNKLCAASVLVFRPGLENSSDGEGKLRLITYSLERAANATRSGKIVVIIDHRQGKLTLGNMPSLSLLRSIVYTLQRHYPGRLVGCYFINAPVYVSGAVRALRPLLDVGTRRLLQFKKADSKGLVEIGVGIVGVDCLPVEYGGNVDYEFVLDKYLPQ